ncbi:MAG: hypothetical protein V3U02_09620, partial [Calditrichia bacterium]
MKTILIIFVICHLSFFFYSCTAIKSTANAVGGSVSSLFNSPRKLPERITDPYRLEARLSVLWVGHATTLIQI